MEPVEPGHIGDQIHAGSRLKPHFKFTDSRELERLSLIFTAVLASFEVAESLGACSQRTSHE
jgi:hypothetical protein